MPMSKTKEGIFDLRAAAGEGGIDETPEGFLKAAKNWVKQKRQAEKNGSDLLWVSSCREMAQYMLDLRKRTLAEKSSSEA
ncbi:hypothetical protein A2841_01265 [Candidatus Kaiserbacteria bacterium RIFCSPHIGHO2_01_FULL_48_10]|uniref:Uncharacterized protein n=1 Tax=Candidatus Kaiserbacteria bacterium RIFCSPHIGHO2_01_FULL_48_10 TaxID=1798476 RepID=A0A1F6C315_9BACT|nr:MAG: hypothetical protein A2841_01265 [Candidatus Kaiserbacteria bacterium RIFCSPHIGHO2_01_FULL_48_10]